MAEYFVTYEARQDSAIGEYSPVTVSVTAPTACDLSHVYRLAREKLRAMGMDVRFPVSLIEQGANHGA